MHRECAKIARASRFVSMSSFGNSRRAPAVFPAARPLSWCVGIVLVLSVGALVLNLRWTAPYLWPAGSGLSVEGDAHFTGTWGQHTRILARPPRSPHLATVVHSVVAGSPSDAARLRAGDAIVARGEGTGAIHLDGLDVASEAQWLRSWRAAYHAGLSAPLAVMPRAAGEAATHRVLVSPHPAWSRGSNVAGAWLARYGGLFAQVGVFLACAWVLLGVRGDVTAGIAALALAFCAVANIGPLQGAEHVLPWPLAPLLTVFAWNAVPFAFPCIALALAYFPAQSPLLRQHPWLHAVPVVAVAPLLAGSLSTSLYLVGFDVFEGLAALDARRPEIYYASFSMATLVNVLAMGEGVVRYRRLTDANERRRIRLAMGTSVVGVTAFALKEGVSAVFVMVGASAPDLPIGLVALLDVLVLLPALGVTYAVTVHRVLGPRWFLRRSLQYALAERTLMWMPLLAAVPLAVSIYLQRDRTLADIASGAPAFYLALALMSVGAFQVRARARGWLDRRFFRTEYDSRELLLSLAGRLRFETDPGGLADLVVAQLDQALHPRTVALLVGGLEAGNLVPVAVRHGSVESLPLSSPVVPQLQRSDAPLDVELSNSRSPLQQLPEEDREWLLCANAALLVPVLGQDRTLVGVLLLGDKQSDEAYDAEDKDLLSNVAAQVGLFLDVARLRDRVAESEARVTLAAMAAGGPPPSLAACPTCGRCDEVAVASCSEDGSPMEVVWNVPHVVESRYRVERRLGRGGMGDVFRAYDQRLERSVAVKVVRADRHLPSSAVGRFRREAQIVAKLRHPSIVAVYDFGTVPGGAAFLVMELVGGHDLRHHLRLRGRFTVAQAVHVLGPTCAALAAAHREGVLHRDVKPENILLTESTQEVKVLDFGIAKLLGEEDGAGETMMGATVTQAGTILGTPAYMSPEQLRGEPLDPRSDVFSVGVVAYELLAGALPFGAASLADIAVRHRERPPSLTAYGVPSAIDALVHAALSYERDARPSSAADFASRLT